MHTTSRNIIAVLGVTASLLLPAAALAQSSTATRAPATPAQAPALGELLSKVAANQGVTVKELLSKLSGGRATSSSDINSLRSMLMTKVVSKLTTAGRLTNTQAAAITSKISAGNVDGARAALIAAMRG